MSQVTIFSVPCGVAPVAMLQPFVLHKTILLMLHG